MKFGGLSENEVSKISTLLKEEEVPFTVGRDEEIDEFNAASMQNNLRHYTPPNISTHVLAITIEDEDFYKISENGRAKLLEFGITDQAPAPEDFKPFTGESIHKDLVDGPKRVVAFNLKHQIIVALLLLFLIWFFRTIDLKGLF